MKFACEVDSYIKKRNRIRAVDSLKNFPTDFYGPGWDVKYSDVNNFKFLGEIKHTQISEIVSNYKVLLKRIYGEKLPHYIINGKKFGFGVGLPHINSKFNSKNQLKEKLMESMM